MRKPKQSLQDRQKSIAFDYHEQLRSIIEDLARIEKMIPRESSRYGCLMNSKSEAEEMAIIESRKQHLLGYIQIVCRDHIIWSKKLLAKGWIAE